MRLLLVVLVIALGARVAHADDAFRDATRMLGAGDLEGAQAAFDAIVAADPANKPLASEALAEAARVAERRGDFAGAQARWQRIVDDYGGERQAPHARKRVAALAERIGDDGAWLEVAEQVDAIQRAAVRAEDPTPQAEAMAALLAAHPDYPRAFEARMWTGDTWLRLGLPARAEAVYADALAATQDPAQQWAAAKARGDALAAQGQLDDAERVYRGLYGAGDLQDRALDRELDTLAKIRARARLRLLCWLGLALALVIVTAALAWATRSPRVALRALARPPVDVVYFVPVALIFGAVAWRGNDLVAGAVRWILLGGLVTTWLVGASLEACRRHRRIGAPLVLLHIAAATIAIASVCYLSVFHDQLLDLLAETWNHGHDIH